MIAKMIAKIKILFCKHDWEKINNETDNPLTDCDMYSFNSLHKCKKCGKERMIGSGWFLV